MSSTAPEPFPSEPLPSEWSPSAILPGLLLAAGLALAAFALRAIPGLGVMSPMILAILLGIAVRNLYGAPLWAQAGMRFALRRILRAAIVLLGLQITGQQVAEVGASGLAVIAATLVAAFGVTRVLGRYLGVDRKLTELIAAGTSICGASAVIACNTVTSAPDEDVAYAVACVTVFGTLSMFLYPALPGILHLAPRAYGLWAGASIHEIAQVVAASFQDGEAAGHFATVAKLARVGMLAPMILALGYLARRRAPAAGAARCAPPVPWFVLGFVALAVLNSAMIVPDGLQRESVPVTAFLLSLSLAAMGLETDIAKLAAKGFRPLALAALSWIFISGFSLALVKMLG